MSYELYIDGIPKAQVATIAGWENLAQAFSNRRDALGLFIRQGWTRDIDGMKRSINFVLSNVTIPPDVRLILEGLRSRLPKSRMTVSISPE